MKNRIIHVTKGILGGLKGDIVTKNNQILEAIRTKKLIGQVMRSKFNVDKDEELKYLCDQRHSWRIKG